MVFCINGLRLPLKLSREKICKRIDLNGCASKELVTVQKLFNSSCHSSPDKFTPMYFVYKQRDKVLLQN